MERTLQHITSIAHLTRSDAEHIFHLARKFREDFHQGIHQHSLEQKVVVNAFFENSTRTKNSFEIAALRLGAKVVSFSSTGSSVAKGESLFDTLQTLDAMFPDVIVMRNSLSGSAEYATRYVGASILNAGDGKHEHPSQALLDALTLLDVYETLEDRCIGIVGDIVHSRVARSNVLLLQLLGAKVFVCGPQTLIPTDISTWNVQTCTTVNELIEECDTVMALRIQKERMDAGLIGSAGEYRKFYGIQMKHIETKPSLYVMHPGPVNYGVEIDFDVANSHRSLIRKQVTNGVFIRMAMLSVLKGRE